jgi:hypothetical protein
MNADRKALPAKFQPREQALAVYPESQRFVLAATNAHCQSDGRNLNSKKEYPGNSSPLYIWDMPKS